MRTCRTVVIVVRLIVFDSETQSTDEPRAVNGTRRTGERTFVSSVMAEYEYYDDTVVIFIFVYVYRIMLNDIIVR